MKVEILKYSEIDSGHKARVTVRIPGAEKTVAVRDALVGLAREARLTPGQGDIRSVLEQQFGASRVAKGVTTFVAQVAASEVVNERGLHIMFNPAPLREEQPDIFEDGSCEMTIEMVLKPTYELSDYGPVEVHMPDASVTEAMVDEAISQQIAQFAEYVEVEGAYEEGDYILVAMTTTINGEAAPSLSGDTMRIVLERGSMPDAWVDNVVGMQLGEERTFTFADVAPGSPDGTPPETFTCTVRAIERRQRVLPELTPEFIQMNFIGMGKDEETFRAEVRRQMELQMGDIAKQQIDNLIDAELASRIKGRIPDLYIERARQELLDNMSMQLAAQGQTIQGRIKEMGTDEQQFGMMVALQARDGLRQGFALDAVFEHEGLEITDEDVEAALHDMAPGHEDEARRNFDRNHAWFVVREMAARMKAHEFAKSQAIIK